MRRVMRSEIEENLSGCFPQSRLLVSDGWPRQESGGHELTSEGNFVDKKASWA